jgi:hypothetical protein
MDPYQPMAPTDAGIDAEKTPPIALIVLIILCSVAVVITPLSALALIYCTTCLIVEVLAIVVAALKPPIRTLINRSRHSLRARCVTLRFPFRCSCRPLLLRMA